MSDTQCLATLTLAAISWRPDVPSFLVGVLVGAADIAFVVARYVKRTRAEERRMLDFCKQCVDERMAHDLTPRRDERTRDRHERDEDAADWWKKT